MHRRSFALAALPALAVGLFLFAEPAQAQRWGFGRGMGFGLGVGYGSPYYGGYGWGSRYGWNGWNGAYSPWYGYNTGYWGNRYYTRGYNTYYPSNWDYSWNYPSGTFYDGGTLPSNYYGFAPTYNYSGMNTADFGTMPGGYTSFYSADQRRREDIPETAALINVRLHPNAEVWFSGEKTHSTGAFRQYVTPALDGNKLFYYEVRARWNENGRDVDRTRRVLVHAGDRINIDFAPDMTAVDEMIPEHLQNDRRDRATERRFYEEGRNNNLERNDLNPDRVPPPPPDQNDRSLNRTNNSQAAPADNARPRTDTNVTPATPSNTTNTENKSGANSNRPPR